MQTFVQSYGKYNASSIWSGMFLPDKDNRDAEVKHNGTSG